MKTLQSLLTIFFLIVFTNLSSLAQEQSLGIKIVSGSKAIFTDPEGLQNLVDETYLRLFDAYYNKALTDFRSSVKNFVGQATRAESYFLNQSNLLILEEKSGKAVLKYHIPFNSVNFRITTPDIVLGIGSGRGSDPEYNLNWSMSFIYEVSTNGNLDQLQVFFKGIQLEDQKLNDRSVIKNAIIDAFRGAYEVKGEIEDWKYFGFQDHLFRSASDLAIQMKDAIQNYFNQNVKQNETLLVENQIDGTNALNLLCDLNTNTLIFEHPYSPSGMVARSSTEKVKEANTTLSVPTSTVPVSTKASDINKKPSATTPRSSSVIKKQL